MQKKCLYIFFVLIFFLIFPNTIAAEGTMVINEFSIHPSSGNKEWVEIYSDIDDLANYWIDDDTDFLTDNGGSAKKHLEGVKELSENYFIFELNSAMFNNAGDYVVLFSPEGNIIDQYQYTTDPGVDITFGRTPDGSGNFQILASATYGNPNSPPQPTYTPTPAPTIKPMKQPTITKIPTAVKIKSQSSTTSYQINPSISLQQNGSRGKGNVLTRVASNGAYPTSILGASTAASKKTKPRPTEKVLVKSASTTPSLFLVFGGAFVLSCGILIYFRKRKA